MLIFLVERYEHPVFLIYKIPYLWFSIQFIKNHRYMLIKHIETFLKITAKGFTKTAIPSSYFLISIKKIQNLFFFEIVSFNHRLSIYPTYKSAPNSGSFFNTKIIVTNEKTTKHRRRF
jgi:hypothetical protein